LLTVRLWFGFKLLIGAGKRLVGCAVALGMRLGLVCCGVAEIREGMGGGHRTVCDVIPG
jgi:hypothetical protein